MRKCPALPHIQSFPLLQCYKTFDTYAGFDVWKRQRPFSSPSLCTDRLWVHPASYPVCTGACSLDSKITEASNWQNVPPMSNYGMHGDLRPRLGTGTTLPLYWRRLKTTRHHNTQDHVRNVHRRENLKSQAYHTSQLNTLRWCSKRKLTGLRKYQPVGCTSGFLILIR